MPINCHGERFETEIGRPAAAKVGDKPTALCYPLHPVEIAQDFLVFQMVGEKRANNQIDGFICRVNGISVSYNPSDPTACRGKLTCSAHSVRIEVDAREF